jgi:hypothetical protein
VCGGVPPPVTYYTEDLREMEEKLREKNAGKSTR